MKHNDWGKEKQKLRGRVTKVMQRLQIRKGKKYIKKMEPKCRHLWIRKDASKIRDPWEVFDDYKFYNCAKCRKEILVWEFVIYGSK